MVRGVEPAIDPLFHVFEVLDIEEAALVMHQLLGKTSLTYMGARVLTTRFGVRPTMVYANDRALDLFSGLEIELRKVGTIREAEIPQEVVVLLDIPT